MVHKASAKKRLQKKKLRSSCVCVGGTRADVKILLWHIEVDGAGGFPCMLLVL